MPTNLPLDDVVPGDVEDALRLARDLGSVAENLRGPGRFADYLHVLRRLGALDLTTARVVEPHLDALAILDQAGLTPADVGADAHSTWGVFASRAPELRAEQHDDVWRLAGRKPWCSLADRLSHAVITAGTPEGQRAFALDLRQPGVTASAERWVSRGLADVRSTGIELTDVPVQPVGEPGFYLSRDGFAWGGIGVAAVWAGGVDALTRHVREAAGRREPDQVALMHLGRLDASQHVLDTVLADAARRVEAGEADGADGQRLAARVRAVVADLGERALTTAGHALGPGPLTGDEGYARLVADLTVYLRQQHAERSDADLGRLALEG